MKFNIKLHDVIGLVFMALSYFVLAYILKANPWISGVIGLVLGLLIRDSIKE